MPFTSRINWKEEISTLKDLGYQGYSQSQIAEKYGVSRQRIKQVLQRYIPDWKDKYRGEFVRNREEKREELLRKKWGNKTKTGLYHIQRAKFRNKKAQAISKGRSFELDFGDLEWPTHCPILGIELDYYAERTQENSPSFDCIDPSKGYINGNVVVMSWRANRIKNDGTAEEHKKIYEYLSRHTF